jgi:acetyl/propionyl-CoA carboxylase alpha subunit/acetyl-CoA carboxylase carboxyltransferase component
VISEGRPIRRLGIVNRGEAAMRCIRAVKALRALEGSDLVAVALFTEPDRDAPFVRHADECIELSSEGGAVAAYLDHDKVLTALQDMRVDAVWPGWGFVAEDPVFVARLKEAGIAFLGPEAEAMRSLGDKITSKQLAEKAGVPVTAWSGRALEDVADAAMHAERIGYPIVIKATAGGGGRGIRLVYEPEKLAAAFESARSEAKAAFGNGDLFCEKLVSGGRHIEVQIAADLHGTVRALGCRDCSVQRRNQKVIEEAPPPGFTAALREAIQDSAVRLARHVSYSGVGTVEFLLEGEAFYFLEVNPRLQVEHGITEEITGVDLVQTQLRIARGESVAGLNAEERGVALEARVCAEDPDEDFLPSPGRIVCFDPALGPRVRLDSGVAAGTVISSDFDSLIAKVIATGDDREEARARLAVALRDFELVVEGGATNKGYLLDVLDAPAYRAGPVDTRWLDRFNEEREREALELSPLIQDSFVAAAIVAYQQSRGRAREIFYSDSSAVSRERIPPSEGQQIDLSHDGESYRTMVYAIGAWRYRVHLDGLVVAARLREEGEHRARLEVDDRVRRVVYDASELSMRLEVDGHPVRFGLQTAGQVRSTSPAMVVSVGVKVGDNVAVGDALGLLEAMKMEIGFRAPVAGVVSEVLVRSGQQVAAGDVLLVIDPGEAEAEGASARASARIELPQQVDPLALFFVPGTEGPLGEPDLVSAGVAEPSARGQAAYTVREEIRRVVLGYDVNPDRAERLVAFLEAELPDELPEAFKHELSNMRHELETFADIEEIFIRAPRASASGELGPSNDARFRMYVRRLHAGVEGIAEEFLQAMLNALRHYGITDLEPSGAHERAVLRMLSIRLESKLRHKLVLGVLRHISALAKAGVTLEHDRTLARSLARIARLRPQVGDIVADAALEASYLAFLQPGIERRAARTSAGVDEWLASAETELTVPPTQVLLELAAAPRPVFERLGHWIELDDPARKEIALAAHTQRRYAPQIPLAYRTAVVEDTRIHCVEYPETGLVLAGIAHSDDIVEIVRRVCRAARLMTEREPGTPIHAAEVVVPPDEEIDLDLVTPEIDSVLGSEGPGCRFTLGLLSREGGIDHVFRTWEPVSGGYVRRSDLYDLHPETAERLDLTRLANFELERIPADEGIYSFYGRARDVPGDERVFVMADARDRSPESGRELANHIAAFERVFNRATRSLRSILQVRDPRRRLQWNRIVIYVAPEIYLELEDAHEVARRLAPATLHLGLEKVIVRVNRLDRNEPDAPSVPIEFVITDSRDQTEIEVREPHRDSLLPAADYERAVVNARRVRQMYPYEIVRMLTTGEQSLVEAARDSDRSALPSGVFEEYDLEEDAGTLRATSVAGRKPGLNTAGIVFGVVSTPTDKVPEGMKRVLVLSDPTRDMGALAAPECNRLVAAIDLAEAMGVPLEWVAVSSGARIAMDSGTENLDATARVVRRIVTFTQSGGVIHVIVAGVNIGAQAYFDALATMLPHTRGILVMTQKASMVLTGRRALEAAGSVSAEDESAIGGYERIMGPNGEAQFYAHSVAEAFHILYDHYRYTYVVPGEAGPRHFETADPAERNIGDSPVETERSFDFSTVGEIFDSESNPGRKRPFAMRAVMSALVDQDGGHLERWHGMVGGETAIVWDAHLGGRAVELIGIESHTVDRDGYRPIDGPEAWNGGTLFPYSSKKVAHAINAASGNRPVVMLANLSGFDGSPESLRKLQLEYGAEIARAVVNFEGPILFLVVSRYHGGAYVVFSQELNPGLHASALTGSFASVIGGGPAASVVFAREVRAQAVADPRVEEKERALRWRPTAKARQELDDLLREVTLEKQAEVAAEFDRVHSVERAREVGSLTDIVRPAEMRPFLIEALTRATEDPSGAS